MREIMLFNSTTFSNIVYMMDCLFMTILQMVIQKDKTTRQLIERRITPSAIACEMTTAVLDSLQMVIGI